MIDKCRHDLSHRDRHQLLRRLPELPVDETRGEAAHERELLGLPWPNFERTRIEGRKGLLHQLLRRHQSDTVAPRQYLPPSQSSPRAAGAR